MRKLAMMAVLLATATTAGATWNQSRVDGDDLRWVSSPDENMRLILRTRSTGKLDVYVDFRNTFGRGDQEVNGLKTVWVFVWFDGKAFGTEDWPTGVEGRSMFVPDKSVSRYVEKIRNSETMTVEVLRPVDDVKLRATFDLRR